MIRVHYQDGQAVGQLGSRIEAWLRELGVKRVVVVAIGSDRSTGDALGPLVGSKLVALRERGSFVGDVLGTLEEPVHAWNLDTVAEKVELEKKEGSIGVIAVDVSLGRQEDLGLITIRRGPLRPGVGLGKSLPLIGDLAVTGCVNVSYERYGLSYMVLSSTRLSVVVKMAGVIAHAIATGVNAIGANASTEHEAIVEAAAGVE